MLSKLNREQREKLAEKIMEWGNLIFIGLFIAQLAPVIPNSPFNPYLAAAGSICLTGAYAVALWLMRRGGD